MVRGRLPNRSCPRTCGRGERGSPNHHCSGENRARNCHCSLARTDTSRWRADNPAPTPWRFNREMDRCGLGPAAIFCALCRTLCQRTCGRHTPRLPRAGFRTSRTARAATEGGGILTSRADCDISCPSTSRTGTSPMRLIWVRHCRSCVCPPAESTPIGSQPRPAQIQIKCHLVRVTPGADAVKAVACHQFFLSRSNARHFHVERPVPPRHKDQIARWRIYAEEPAIDLIDDRQVCRVVAVERAQHDFAERRASRL
jgi:hypothetical protein